MSGTDPSVVACGGVGQAGVGPSAVALIPAGAVTRRSAKRSKDCPSLATTRSRSQDDVVRVDPAPGLAAAACPQRPAGLRATRR
jgi:hypothetical protein